MKLRSYLSGRGETQAQFAARIGVHPISVSRYVTGRRLPEPDVIRRIVVATDGAVTADDLLGLAGP